MNTSLYVVAPSRWQVEDDLTGCEVILCKEEQEIPLEIIDEKKGYFQIPDLPSGRYSLYVRLPDDLHVLASDLNICPPLAHL